MGNERLRVEISFTMSRHNVGRDLRDNALAGEFLKEVKALVHKPMYEPLSLDVSGLTGEFDKQSRFVALMRQELEVQNLQFDNDALHQIIYAAWNAAQTMDYES